MEATNINSIVSVRYCSSVQCLRITEYYCHSCQKDLCLQCQQEHATNLDTKHHRMTLYKTRANQLYVPIAKESCAKHLECVYKKFCESCNIPICPKCLKSKSHRKHKKLDLLKVYENKRKQLEEKITLIRNETIYMFQVLLSELKTDAKTCCKEIADIESAIATKSRKLKYGMNVFLRDGIYFENYMQQRLSTIGKMKRYIGLIQIYEEIHEQSDKSPVRFLQFVKTVRAPRIKDTPRLALYRLLPFTQDFSTEDLVGLMTEIKILEGNKRHIENKKLLKLMDVPTVYDTLSVTGVELCHHISCVTPDQIWVSDGKNIILTDITNGHRLFRIKKLVPFLFVGSLFVGSHTVNGEGELIYIENFFNISKLGKDLKTKTPCIFITKQCPGWWPLSVYCCPSSGDLLVGMKNVDNINNGSIARYNKSEQLTQIIQFDNKGQALYTFPNYITENNNGDVVVSDEDRGVVVTDREGRYRFSYRGRSSGSRIDPKGICTDGLSNILVCDFKSGTVHMIDKDGQFILIRTPLALNKLGRILTTTPVCLSYDVNTHRLWVGSKSENTVTLFRYIKRHSDLTDKIELFDADDAIPSQILAKSG